mmetsp:Transcript_71395/g.167259  ORF Transcript_71395/g.167259 Transcript_71395/m.167259 type:complete len:255 (+) Transcript_71395:57-821(+)
MATRALIDASIDSFWSAAGVPCPVNPHCRDGKRSASVKLPKSLSRGRPKPPQPALVEAEAYKSVSVELSGREGYNSGAVNGRWHFWRVKGGRLAFQRELRLSDEEEDAASPSGSDSTKETDEPKTPKAGGASSPSLLRLFLYYVPQTDAYVISDASDATGSIIADCGPVEAGVELEQNWRVWDGDTWKEDWNVTAEILAPESAAAMMSGLRVLQAPVSARGPPAMQEAPWPRAPLSARPVMQTRTSRQLDSIAK